MKKTKLILPLVGISALGASVVAPLTTLTSCSFVGNVLNMWTDSNGEVYLGGFNPKASKEDIRKQCGDTLEIPKEVDHIIPYAFVNQDAQGNPTTTTIPSFIKYFKFEDGYRCKEIPKYAFFGAPFESVEINCERYDGMDPEGRPCARNVNGWGLTKLGYLSFFQTKNLKYIKLCATIKDIEKGDLGGQTDYQFVFGYSDTWPVTNYDEQVKTNLEILDLSDINFSVDQGDQLPGADGPFIYGNLYSTFKKEETETEKQYTKHVLMRAYNGCDGDQKMGDATYLNEINQYFGLPPVPFGPDGFKISVNGVGNTWSYEMGAINAKVYQTFNIGGTNYDGLSTACLTKEIPYPQSGFVGEICRPYFEFDMNNWKGSFGNKWKVCIVKDSQIKPIYSQSVNITLDGEEIDFTTDADGAIIINKELSQQSVLKIKFWANGQVMEAHVVLMEAN